MNDLYLKTFCMNLFFSSVQPFVQHDDSTKISSFALLTKDPTAFVDNNL